MIGAKASNDTIEILASGVAHPALVVTLFKVYGEFAFVMFAVGAFKKILIVGPIRGPQHISQYLEFFVFHLPSRPLQLHSYLTGHYNQVLDSHV